MYKTKQVIIARRDLKLSKGKLAAQVAHASVDAVLKSGKKIVAGWRDEGMPKVVLSAKNATELRNLLQKARGLGLVTSLIADAGLTEIEKGTITAGAIGPDDEKKINKVTGSLKLLN
jgi:PTH2 family peptidyl-tRNA hydrolase